MDLEILVDREQEAFYVGLVVCLDKSKEIKIKIDKNSTQKSNSIILISLLTVLHLSNLLVSTFSPCMTMIAAMTALVVAIAGIMLPAIAKQIKNH